MEYQKTVHTETRTGAYATPVPGLSLRVRHHVEYGNPEFGVSLQPDAGDVSGLAYLTVFGPSVREAFILAPSALSDAQAALVVGAAFYGLTYDAAMQLSADFGLTVRRPAWAQEGEHAET